MKENEEKKKEDPDAIPTELITRKDKSKVPKAKSFTKAPSVSPPSAVNLTLIGRTASNKVHPETEGDVEQGDPWSTLEMTPELVQVLKSNGITISTAKELQDKLGAGELFDLQIVDEDMLKSLAVSPIQLKKVKAMIGR